MTARRSLGPTLAITAACLLLSACSAGTTDYLETATGLIEGELAEQLGFPVSDATCIEPDAELAVGDTFDCTATTDSGETIDYTATVDAEDHVEVATDNVITIDDLPEIEGIVAGQLSTTVGINLPVENVDCGAVAIVIAAEPIVCALTDPDNGDIYDTTLTNIDLSTPGEIFFDINVADAPRG